MEASEKYLILSPLGRNQKRKFGSLFLVSNKLTNEKGVMKVLPKTAQSTVALERLRAESSFHFTHNGLPQILDVFESDQEYILIRKYIEGKTLDVRFQEIKKRERHRFLCNVLQQLGLLLNNIHDRDIYHCDIKPGNILVENDGTVHLIDFGLALQKGQKDNRKLLFPLGYAAPELLLNQLSLVDRKTDYFALGITIWRLYSEKLPLTHPNPSVFTNLQLTHPLPESDAVSKYQQKVLLKMCHKHAFSIPPNSMDSKEVQRLLKSARDQRYATFEQFFSAYVAAGNRRFFTRQYRDDTPG